MEHTPGSVVVVVVVVVFGDDDVVVVVLLPGNIDRWNLHQVLGDGPHQVNLQHSLHSRRHFQLR